jgi:heme A synthase
MIEPSASITSVSLHATAGVGLSGSEVALIPLLVFGGLASAALAGLGAVAFSRRRSRSYLLITLALVALGLKAFLGGLWLIEFLPIAQHHLLEHGMDVAIALLLVAAIYDARRAPMNGRTETEGLE